MAIEIYYDMRKTGKDIRGSALYISDVLHGQFIEICGHSKEKYPHLEELGFIEEEQNIVIQPTDADIYIQELKLLVADSRLFQPVTAEIEKFVSVLSTIKQTKENLNAFLDY